MCRCRHIVFHPILPQSFSRCGRGSTRTRRDGGTRQLIPGRSVLPCCSLTQTGMKPATRTHHHWPIGASPIVALSDPRRHRLNDLSAVEHPGGGPAPTILPSWRGSILVQAKRLDPRRQSNRNHPPKEKGAGLPPAKAIVHDGSAGALHSPNVQQRWDAPASATMVCGGRGTQAVAA